MNPIAPAADPSAPSAEAAVVEAFERNLARRRLALVRGKTHALQVNTGFHCDLACRHCHFEAGPQRTEVIAPETMEAVVAYASRVTFEVIDVTGGAPELAHGIHGFLSRLAPLTRQLILRTNLVALREPAAKGLMETCRDLGVALVASFPATQARQADALRGAGFWEKSLGVLRDLNRLGYGVAGSGLTLDLVVNPAGAFLPADQGETEGRFKVQLARLGLSFNRLYSFANVPLGRFRAWLVRSGNLEPYFKLLYNRFNPAAVEGLMCRTLISVSWDGILYDCDFNIASGLPHGGRRIHVSALEDYPAEGVAIPTGDHCYACTAGAGFS